MKREMRNMIANGIINAISRMSITDIMMLDSMLDAIFIKAIMPKPAPAQSTIDNNIDGYIRLAKAIIGEDADECKHDCCHKKSVDVDYDERKKKLDNREHELNVRDVDLDDREIGLDLREEELDEREAELDEREAELNRREAELDERECDIDDREDMLKEDVIDDDDDYDDDDYDDKPVNNTEDIRDTIVSLINGIVGALKK